VQSWQIFPLIQSPKFEPKNLKQSYFSVDKTDLKDPLKTLDFSLSRLRSLLYFLFVANSFASLAQSYNLDGQTQQRINFFQGNRLELLATGLPNGIFEVQCKLADQSYRKEKWSNLITGARTSGDYAHCDRNAGWVVVQNGSKACCAWEPQLRFAYDQFLSQQNQVRQEPLRHVQTRLPRHYQQNQNGTRTSDAAEALASEVEFVKSIYNQTLSAQMPVQCPMKGAKNRNETWSCAGVIGSPTSGDLSFVTGPNAPCSGLYLVRSCTGDPKIPKSKTCCATASTLANAVRETRHLQNIAGNFNQNQDFKNQQQAKCLSEKYLFGLGLGFDAGPKGSEEHGVWVVTPVKSERVLG